MAEADGKCDFGDGWSKNRVDHVHGFAVIIPLLFFNH
jgi:hypothetical protein